MTQKNGEKRGQIVSTRDGRDQILDMIARQEGEITKALGSDIDPKKYMRMAVTAIKTADSRLFSCPPVSVVIALTQAAQLGLEVDPLIGHAYVVPRWNTATSSMWGSLMLGYRGLLMRALRSGAVAMFDAGVVRRGDHFVVRQGSNPHLEHVEDFESPSEGEVIASYAIAHFANGYHRFVVCPRWRIEAAKKNSDLGKRSSGPWKTNYGEMAQKTALRRLCGFIPMDEDTRSAITREEMEESGRFLDSDRASSHPRPANPSKSTSAFDGLKSIVRTTVGDDGIRNSTDDPPMNDDVPYFESHEENDVP